MKTLPQLPDGLSWRDRGVERAPFIHADDSSLGMWLDIDGGLHGSLRARPDAAHLQ